MFWKWFCSFKSRNIHFPRLKKDEIFGIHRSEITWYELMQWEKWKPYGKDSRQRFSLVYKWNCKHQRYLWHQHYHVIAKQPELNKNSFFLICLRILPLSSTCESISLNFPFCFCFLFSVFLCGVNSDNVNVILKKATKTFWSILIIVLVWIVQWALRL